MKKQIITILASALMLMSGIQAYAIPARPTAFKHIQPDGTSITVRLHGDEFHHWATNEKGERITLGEDGFYRMSEGSHSDFLRAAQLGNLKRAEMAAKVASSAERAPLSMGENHFLVVLVEFSDLAFGVTNPQQAFTNLLNQEGYSANGGTGSARDYYVENSNGRFKPTYDVVGPVKISNKYSYYGTNSNGDDAHAAAAFAEACRLLDSEINFAEYDHDKDGYVDNVFFYYAGYNEAEGAAANTIWPHKWDFGSASYYDSAVGSIRLDGVRLGSYACTSEYSGSRGAQMCGIGTFCHEFGHVIGLPDLYDVDYETNGEGTALYNFSLMCSGSYNNNGRTPPYLSGIEREMLGWMTIPQWTDEGVKALGPVQDDNAFMIPTAVSGEYFVFETRTGEGWDKYLVDDRRTSYKIYGLVAYHVDKSNNKVSGSVTAKSLWPNSINSYSAHQCLDLIKAKKSSYYYDFPFAGYSGVTEYSSTSSSAFLDWAGNPTGYGLFDIAYKDGVVTFNLKTERTDELYMKGINAIANPGRGIYKAGGEFALEILESNRPPKSVAWSLDDKAVSGTSVKLTAGEHVIKAKLTFSDGTTETLEQKVKAQ